MKFLNRDGIKHLAKDAYQKCLFLLPGLNNFLI